MGFVSIGDLAKSRRKPNGKGGVGVPLIAVTQAYYESRTTCMITISLSAICMDRSRLKKGDKVEVFYNPDDSMWKLKLNTQGKGYTISGNQNSESGIVRFTHYQGMPLIGDRTERLVRAVCEDESVEPVPGEVVFKLQTLEVSDDEDVEG